MSSVWHLRDARAARFVAMSTAAGNCTKVAFAIEIRNPPQEMRCGGCGKMLDVTSFHQRPINKMLLDIFKIVRHTKHVFLLPSTILFIEFASVTYNPILR